MNMPALLIPLAGMAIPIVLVPVTLGLKHARLLRELEHAERMRAMELGRTLPQDEPWWNPARISVAIGAGVPIGVFLIAWLASLTMGSQEEVWVFACVVGTAGVIGGSILGGKHFTLRAQAESNASAAFANKPGVDDDAYDVVSSRG